MTSFPSIWALPTSLVVPSPASPAIHDDKEIPHLHHTITQKKKNEKGLASAFPRHMDTAGLLVSLLLSFGLAIQLYPIAYYSDTRVIRSCPLSDIDRLPNSHG